MMRVRSQVRARPPSTPSGIAMPPLLAEDPTAPAPAAPAAATTRPFDVWFAWWPLALSWIFMGLELPAVSAAMARMPLATVSLAAYGGGVVPLALLIASPILLLLSAPTPL